MNSRKILNDRFFIVSGIGLQQTAQGVALDNADLDTRDKCTVAREEVIVRNPIRNCRDEDLIGSKTKSRFARYTLTYSEVTPQIITRWTAYDLGGSAAPTGTPANEVQTLAVAADGTISLTLEGRTVETKTIPSAGITAAKIQAALTAARMRFIQPGDVVVTGSSSPFTITFPNTGRLGRADIPLMIGSGGMTVTASANGQQNHHVLTRSVSRDKVLFPFALGWDDDDTRVEKYIDYAVEQITPSISLDGNVGLTVVIMGPWEYDSIETNFDIAACMNIDPLEAQDCRILTDGRYQTVDMNTLTAPINDNIPTDRLSAFSFDGIDIQKLRRGVQPAYGPIQESIFGSEIDTDYALAQNERTEDPVPLVIHFGYPGNRCTWNFPETKIRFQTNRMGEAGEARVATIQLEGEPWADGLNAPFNAEAWLDQTSQFLDVP